MVLGLDDAAGGAALAGDVAVNFTLALVLQVQHLGKYIAGWESLTDPRVRRVRSPF